MRAFQFYWFDATLLEAGTDSEKYQRIVQWAEKARSINPDVFDSLTQWLFEAEKWNPQECEENRDYLLNDIFARFLAQNAILRKALTRLEPSGIVNPPVFEALDRFDDELHGNTHAVSCKKPLQQFFQTLPPCKFRKSESFLPEAQLDVLEQTRWIAMDI